MKKLLIAAAGIALAVTLSSAAFADGMATHKGLYVSGAIGANWLEDADLSGSIPSGLSVDFDTGYVGALAVGYALGNGLRIEGELAHRRNDIDGLDGLGFSTGSGDFETSSFMANLVYDFNLKGRFTPYIGAGVGFANIDVDGSAAGVSVDDDDTVFAYQGILGVAYHLRHQLDLFADYRYFQTEDPDFKVIGIGVEAEYRSHSLMVGLRYRFAVPKPAPRPRPAAAPPPPKPMPMPKPKPVAKPKPKPAPPPLRSFIVFFDWDKSNVRADAQRVIEAAAAYAKRRGFVRVNLAGHADRSGSAKYNMGLSLRRAAAVKAAFVKLGIKGRDIATVGRGESQPLVATADGVREPRNRRVEIAF